MRDGYNVAAATSSVAASVTSGADVDSISGCGVAVGAVVQAASRNTAKRKI